MKKVVHVLFALGFLAWCTLLAGCLITHFPTPPIVIEKPLLSNPVEVGTSGAQRCAIDDTGLHCWGSIRATQRAYDEWQRKGLTKLDIAVVNPRYFRLKSGSLCVIGETETFCQAPRGWIHDALDLPYPSPDYRDHRRQFDQFTRPTYISMTSHPYPVCVISDLGIECADPFDTVVPKFTNAIALDVGDYHACGIDANGLQCWVVTPNRNQWLSDKDKADLTAAITVPAGLLNPTQVAVGRFTTCVLDDSGIQCWGAGGHYSAPTASLNGPTQLVWGGYNSPGRYCALDASNAECWDAQSRLLITPPPPVFIAPIKIAAGSVLEASSYKSTCVIDASGVVCW